MNIYRDSENKNLIQFSKFDQVREKKEIQYFITRRSRRSRRIPSIIDRFAVEAWEREAEVAKRNRGGTGPQVPPIEISNFLPRCLPRRFTAPNVNPNIKRNDAPLREGGATRIYAFSLGVTQLFRPSPPARTKMARMLWQNTG